MKSIRRAILGNQEYHHNLLGKEFDALVAEATEKTLRQPNTEANKNVILAINDPNTGMELTPTKVSQELRRQLRSSSPQKQWLAVVLIREVLMECSTVVEPVVVELLEAVTVIATMDVRTSGQAARNAKQVAMEILNRHGHAGRQALRRRYGTSHIRQQSAPSITSAQKSEPGRSIGVVQTYEQSCKNHCEVVQGLILSGEAHEMTNGLIEELLEEIKHMRKILVTSVERLSSQTGTDVEAAIVKGFEAIDAADRVIEVNPTAPVLETASLQLHAKGPSEIQELTLRDLAPATAPSAASVDLLGDTLRNEKTDASELDILEEGLHQPEADPFQALANRAASVQPSTNHNPFTDSTFSF